METSELLAMLRPLLHDRKGALTCVGRMPRQIEEICVTPLEPADVSAATLVVAPAAVFGPAVAIGDAAWAHPGGLLAELFGAIGVMREDPLALGRTKLRKLTVFVPETHLDILRDAVSAAGAGSIGSYSDCTFTAHGEGTFLPLPGAKPYLGSVGARAKVAEARLEAIYPPYREEAVLVAMRQVHPYEEIAYDVLELENRDPTYASVRQGTVEPVSADAILEQVLRVSGSNAIFVSGSDRVVRHVLCGRGIHLTRALARTQPDLVLTDHLEVAELTALHRAGALVAELRDLETCALQHAAKRLGSALPIPVREASEGLVWRRYGKHRNIDRS